MRMRCHSEICEMTFHLLVVQRYAQSSQFKRTVLEFIAEEMLESRASANPPDAPSSVCRITAGATPVVTSPTDSSMQYLYERLGLGQSDVADRHDISSGLRRLGKSTSLFRVDLHRHLYVIPPDTLMLNLCLPWIACLAAAMPL